MLDANSSFSPIFRLFGIFLFFLYLSTVQGTTYPSRNITINDSDSQIIYSPGWKDCKDLNSHRTEFGKKCRWSDRDDAYAEFEFIGVAVYLISPLWSSAARVQITLDSEPTRLVDLQNSFRENEWEGSMGGGNVAWGVSGLENGTHTLRIEKGAGMQYVVLEALIYTSATITSGPKLKYQVPRSFEVPSHPDQTSILHASRPSVRFLHRRANGQSMQPVILGVVLGLVIALIGVGLGVVFVCYRTRIIAKYGYLIGIPTYAGDERQRTTSPTHPPQTASTPFATPVYNSYSASTTEARNVKPPMSVQPRPRQESKALPSTPPTPPTPQVTSPTSPSAKFAKAVARRFPTQLTLQVPNKDAGHKSKPPHSTSSSFFPQPQEAEIPLIEKHQRTSSEISHIDVGRGNLSKPPLTITSQSSTGKASAPNSGHPGSEEETPGKGAPHPWSGRQFSLSSASTHAHTETPLSSSPEVLGRHEFPPRNSSKSALTVSIPLFPIAEIPNQGRLTATESPSSAKSSFKRKSEGRARVEKEKYRRRHHRVVVPTGPRDRLSDLSSRPNSRVTSYAASSARTSAFVDFRPPTPPLPRLPRPLPPRPDVPTMGSPGNRPETPLPPYAIGNEILPLYYEKTKRISRRSLRPPLNSATSNRHFLPSPPPSATASSSGDVTPTPTPQPNLLQSSTPQSSPPLSRPLPAVVKNPVARLQPRKLPLPAPARPRALTDSSPPGPRLPVPTHVKRNRSVDLPPPSEQQVYIPATTLVKREEEEAKARQLKPRKSYESSTSGISSVSSPHTRRPPPQYNAKSPPYATMQMKNLLSEHEKRPPTSVPVTPQKNSWAESTFRHTKSSSIREVDEGEKFDPRTSGDNRVVSLSKYQVVQLPRSGSSASSSSIAPLNLSTPEKKKRTAKVPPPLVKLTVASMENIREGVSASDPGERPPLTPSGPRTPNGSSSRVNLPPPPETPPPPTPPTPRRRGKVWDDTGRKRGGRITPPIRESSLAPANRHLGAGGSAYSV